MSIVIFHIGDRVELQPHLDLWMRGARFGTVHKITRNGVRVKLDNLPRKDGTLFRRPAESLRKLDTPKQRVSVNDIFSNPKGWLK